MDKKKIKRDFNFLKGNESVLAVLVFGSQVKDKVHSRSDIDICIVAPEEKPRKILGKVFRNINTEKKNYDVHIFEEMTLRIKHQVIKDHEIIWCRSKRDLKDHFHKYSKIWRDQAKARNIA